MVPNEKKNDPYFRPFLEACKEHGLSKTVAYELINSGDLHSFTIGAKRYIVMDEFKKLADKLAAAGEPPKANDNGRPVLGKPRNKGEG